MASNTVRAWGGVALLLIAGCGFGGGGITPIRTAFNRGVYLESQGAYDAAIAEYREALEEDPGDHRARFNLAMAYEARAARVDPTSAAADRDRARSEYQRILADDPSHPRAGINLAALEYEDDPERGVARLQALIERHPDRVRPRAALGAHHLRAGDIDAALVELRAARALEPGSGQVNLLLGDALMARGDLAEARAAYRAALAGDDENPGVLVALARSERALDEPEAAIAHLERALLIDADHVTAHREIADLHYELGSVRRAVSHAWQVQLLDPDVAIPWLIEAYRRLLDEERARGE